MLSQHLCFWSNVKEKEHNNFTFAISLLLIAPINTEARVKFVRANSNVWSWYYLHFPSFPLHFLTSKRALTFGTNCTFKFHPLPLPLSLQANLIKESLLSTLKQRVALYDYLCPLPYLAYFFPTFISFISSSSSITFHIFLHFFTIHFYRFLYCFICSSATLCLLRHHHGEWIALMHRHTLRTDKLHWNLMTNNSFR